jgi:hypothetical protein
MAQNAPAAMATGAFFAIESIAAHGHLVLVEAGFFFIL